MMRLKSNATPQERAEFWAQAAAVAEPQFARTIERVPIMKVGDWKAARSDGKPGGVTVTRADIEFAAAADATGKLPAVVLGISHPGFQAAKNGTDNAPAVGTVTNLTVTDEDGGTLVADFNIGPKWLADKFATAYPRRSADWNNVDGGSIVHRVSLMGTGVPAIHTLPDIQKVLSDAGFEGEPVALAAAFDEPATPLAPSGDENKPEPAGSQDTNEEGAAVDSKALNELRESLGLAEGTSEEDILAKAIERAKTPVEQAEELTAHEAQETVEVDAVTEEPVAVAAALAPETVEQIQRDAAELRSYRDAERKAKLDAAIDRVVKGGGFHKDTAEVYVQAAATDFAGTLARLEAHPLGLIAPLDGERGVAIEAAAATEDEDGAINYLRAMRGKKQEA